MQIIAVGWLTYAAYYLGRVNFSTAIPGIRENLLLSSQQIGLLGSGFFVAYACGQMFSGYLGDRISPRRLVFGGMLLSVLMNLLFVSTEIWWVMLFAWTINGVSQSTGWAPVLKVLSNWHRTEQRRKVAGIYATSYVAGNALTWTLTGWIIVYANWQAAFWIPALLMGGFALFWLVFVRDNPTDEGFEELSSSSGSAGSESAHTFPQVLRSLSRFWPLALAAVTAGFCLFALIIWLPTYFVERLALGSGMGASLASILPIAGVFGTVAVSWLISTRFAGKEIPFAVAIYLGAGALFVLFPAASSSVSGSLVIVMLIGAILYGATTIITTVMPMLLSQKHETSTIAGFIDFAFNVGAGLAGVVIGAILDRHSWTVAFFVLAGGGAFTACLLVTFSAWERRLERARSMAGIRALAGKTS
ncbi:MAG: MFS transporter [Desulfobacteraceae bacterium]|nr:MFS transporter [Desulfobacteraceae bacterium]